jgi:hypothetical protein
VGGVIVFAAFWLLLVTVLVRDFVGTTRRGTSWRRGKIGWLLVFSASLANSFTEYRGWSSSGLDTVRWITVPLGLAGFVLLGIGTVMRARQRPRGPARWVTRQVAVPAACQNGPKPTDIER